MKELTLREIQLASLEILKTFADICEENGFKYLLAYGTLLGAVRHKGFIPWDDDLDVIMPRPDYNRFIEYCKEHKEQLKPLELMHYSTNKEYIYPIARLSDSRYVADYNVAKDYGLGTFIDIYPYDGCSVNFEESQKDRKKLKYFIALIYLSGLKKPEKSLQGGVIRSVGKLCIYCLGHIIGANRLCEFFDKRSQRINYDNSKYVLCTWDGNITPKSMFENIMYISFESGKFKAPMDYDLFLTQFYGNYMELPPENERVGHHFYKIYKK